MVIFMELPFISYGNEDIIYNLNDKVIFVSGIEIILFRYFLMFKKNNVEKLIAFFKDENSIQDEIEINLKKLFKKPPELYLDNSSLDNKLFIHATHENKINQSDLLILNDYLKTFSASIYNIKASLDKNCPFAISFSFNYNANKIKEENYYRYLKITSK